MTVKLSVITDNLTEPASFGQHYSEHKQLATKPPNLQVDELEDPDPGSDPLGKARVQP